MKDTFSLLLVGCLAASGLGYALGITRYDWPAPPAIQPYDQARAICSDAVKSAQDNEAKCWSALLSERQQQVQVGH